MYPRKSSRKQYEIIINFMEKNGDISRPGIGPAGRLQNVKQWQELVEALNNDPSGIVKPHQKWRGVWSDMKANAKRKYQKYQEALLTNPNARMKMIDLEKRILPFVFGPNFSYSKADSSKTQTQDSYKQEDAMLVLEIVNEDDQNSDDEFPNPSLDPGSPPPSPHPQKSNNKTYSIADALIELNRLTRENESNRDRMMYKLEKERLRQRDVELKLQAQWLSFLNGALDAVHSYLQTS